MKRLETPCEVQKKLKLLMSMVPKENHQDLCLGADGPWKTCEDQRGRLPGRREDEGGALCEACEALFFLISRGF